MDRGSVDGGAGWEGTGIMGSETDRVVVVDGTTNEPAGVFVRSAARRWDSDELHATLWRTAEGRWAGAKWDDTEEGPVFIDDADDAKRFLMCVGDDEALREYFGDVPKEADWRRR